MSHNRNLRPPEHRQQKPFIPPENKLPELQHRFPAVPVLFITKILNEIRGEKNVMDVLTQESIKIEQTTSPDWVRTYYKSFPCSKIEFCQNYLCLYYHSQCERRRIYKYRQYSPVMCAQAAHCPKGDTCEDSHTVNEILYHPQVYRSNACPYLRLQNHCIYGAICSFSHDAEDEAQLLNEFLEAHEQLDSLCKEINGVEIEIMHKMKEEEDLHRKLRCVCGHWKEYVRAPCGHGACQACKERNNCRICSEPSTLYKINLD